MTIKYISLIATSIFLIGLSLTIIKAENNAKNRVFSIFILSIGLWAYGIYLFLSNESLEFSLFFANLNYILASIISASFLHFSYFFNKDELHNNQKIAIYTPIIIIFVSLLINPHLILHDVYISENRLKLATVNNSYYLIYSVYFILYVALSYFNLIKSFLKSVDKKIKIQIKFILIGTIFPYLIATFFDLLLPPINYSYVWIGPLMGLVVVLVLIYAIYKYHIFNVKIITAQLLIFFLWFFTFLRIFIKNEQQEDMANIFLFVISIIFGLLLIKYIFKEIHQREKNEILVDQLNKLNAHLEQRVAEQTMEVKKAFELEKHARREVEKLNETKDQFIMITQHNLRTPVTSIKWESEALLNGDRGGMSPEVEQSVKNISISSKRLIRIVDDFLNITALKIGSHILTKTRGNLKELFEEVINELKIDLNSMNIVIKYPSQDDYWPILDFDKSKMHEVILIIIENAVRYNRKDGNIEITNKIESTNNSKTETEEKILKINIKNTGVGISKEDRTNLFTRLFYRSKKAQATHPIGMGIGLSVARAVVRAHNGDITIESEGENMGATVILTLPIQDK